jgi:predicted membrane protein
MTAERFHITPRLIIGLAILVLGALWTLDNMNILESEDFTQWWPVVLIAIGIVQYVNRRTNRVGPVLLMIVGVLLLASSLDFIDFDLGDLIPLAIAAWGGKLVWDALARRSSRPGIEDGDSVVHAFAVMGGVHWHSNSQEFRGGDANAIMGGVELDLRNVQLKPGEKVIIDALALMGGVEIWVPAGWRIDADVLPIMGAFENKATASSENGPVLTVRGTAVMGAIEVKN